MELKELTQEELIETTGGNEASDGLCYAIGYAAHWLWKYGRLGPGLTIEQQFS